jgi:hypothetical protein
LRTALIFNRTSHRVIALRGAACALPRERFSPLARFGPVAMSAC